MTKSRRLVLWTALGILGGPVFAFEDTQTLPKGVRNVSLRSVHTVIDEKTGRDGSVQALAEPLRKDLTFKNLLDREKGFKRKQLEAFMKDKDNNFAEGDALGAFSANLQGQLDVFAPVVAYGVSDSLTLAVAVPFYRGQTAVATGFNANGTADRFVGALLANQKRESAIEAAEGINDAVGKLNQKLIDNGFMSLEGWEDQGLGDVTVLAKWRAIDMEHFKAASFSGFMAPTGRTDDPDILNDIAFGDGSWDAIFGLSFDEPIYGPLFFNEYVKYNYQFETKKKVRLIEEDEVIEVATDTVNYKPGDKLEAGVSLQVEAQNGLQSGFGYVFSRKLGDRYDAGDSSPYLEEDSDQRSLAQEFLLGYSTVPAYRSGRFAVPLKIKLGLQRHVESKNTPVSDLYKLDLDFYF